MKLIGITGGIGSGKSLVARIFSCLGAPVYYADNRAKWLSDHDPEIILKVKALLGADAYKSGEMNRSYVASQVFNNQELLQKLNAIIHPAVGADFSKWIAEQHFPYVLKEAALLFESGSYKQLDAVIHITAPVDLRIKRTLDRDKHRTREDVLSIIRKQMDDEERLNMSQYEVVNDDQTLVIPQVLALHHSFIQ